MYETFFQMDHTPFSRATPVAGLYESPAMSDTLGRLAYAADRQLFAVVTADAGCGKSTLIRRFVTSLPKELLALGFQAFLIMICVGIYAVLVEGISTSGDNISAAIWGCMGYTVLLCYTLFKTGSLAKSLFGAH